MRYAAAAPLQAVTGDFRRLRQQASLDDVIKEVREQLKKAGPERKQIADLPQFSKLEASVLECLKTEVDLQCRIEALEDGTLQPGYVKNKRTGTFHTVPSGAELTSCGWD